MIIIAAIGRRVLPGEYYAVVETDGVWERQLQKAAAAARATLGSDFYALELWDYRLQVFSETDVRKAMLSEEKYKGREGAWLTILPDGLALPALSEALAISCPTVLVMEEGFHWQCYPKHGDDLVESAGVPWAEFEKGPSLTAELL
jgi:hypothetical protein